MSADHVALLVASAVCAAVTVVLLGVVAGLVRQVRSLRRMVDDLRHEAVPLVRDARVIADQAATELVRVGDVLESAEAVSTTVDSSSRLAYRMFSNPVVKVLAYGTGIGSALRRLVGRGGARRQGSGVAANGQVQRENSVPAPIRAAPPRRAARRRRGPERARATRAEVTR